jgi:integrase
MSSIKKRPGSALYVACYTLPNGQRKQVSTGTDDIYEARQVLNKLEQAANLATKQQLTRRKAFKLINEIAEAAGNPIFEEENIGSFLDRWYRGQTAKESTKKKYKSLIADFKEYLNERVKESALFLSPRDCSGFKQWLIDKGLADTTINAYISTMTAMFDDAEKQQLIEVNPFKAVSRIKKAKSSEKKAFTLEQFKELTEKTEGEWQALIMIAGLSGQRQKDCSTLKWPQVDFDRGTIEFKRQKNNDSFTLPMHPKLSGYLLKLHKAAGRPEASPIMPIMHNRPATGRESISDIFRNDILPRIGIKQKYGGTQGSGRAVSAYSFHSLRHSFSTWLNEIGISETDRMRIVGHSDKKGIAEIHAYPN